MHNFINSSHDHTENIDRSCATDASRRMEPWTTSSTAAAMPSELECWYASIMDTTWLIASSHWGSLDSAWRFKPSSARRLARCCKTQQWEHRMAGRFGKCSKTCHRHTSSSTCCAIKLSQNPVLFLYELRSAHLQNLSLKAFDACP